MFAGEIELITTIIRVRISRAVPLKLESGTVRSFILTGVLVGLPPRLLLPPSVVIGGAIRYVFSIGVVGRNQTVDVRSCRAAEDLLWRSLAGRLGPVMVFHVDIENDADSLFTIRE